MGWKWEPGLVGKMGKVFFKLINKKCGVTGDMAQLLKAKGLQPKGENAVLNYTLLGIMQV